MSVLPGFDPPANITDLTDAALDRALRTEWSNEVNHWTEMAILGDAWTSLNDHNRDFYYNPLKTDLAGAMPVTPISWTAFPNRILYYFPNASFDEQMGYAERFHADGTFGPPPPVQGQPYDPPGPRGWQDEYCEWISVRNPSGKITQVDFTCENPEYWYALWRFDPQTVLKQYRQLVSPAVQLQDLYLNDSQGNPVIDRSTGLPAYNVANQWNTQPAQGQTTGAVHLISAPNSLPAEIYLAAAATLLRDKPPGTQVTDPDALIKCAGYGQAHRNSDPHIGATVNNAIAGGGLKLSLQNPVGLYIQVPDFSAYQLPNDPRLPSGAQPPDCWQIVRGRLWLPGQQGNFILHARFGLPKAWIDAGVSFTVGDITIAGSPIRFGAQIAQTFQIALRGLPLNTSAPPEAHLPCVMPNPNPLPAPQQLQDFNLFQAKWLSTAAMKIAQGQTVQNVVLTAVAAKQGATVTIPEGGVQATITDFRDPGNGAQLFLLTLSVKNNALVGDRSVLLTNPDGTAGPAAPGLLTVTAAGSPAHGLSAAAIAAPAMMTPDLAQLDANQIRFPTRRNRH